MYVLYARHRLSLRCWRCSFGLILNYPGRARGFCDPDSEQLSAASIRRGCGSEGDRDRIRDKRSGMANANSWMTRREKRGSLEFCQRAQGRETPQPGKKGGAPCYCAANHQNFSTHRQTLTSPHSFSAPRSLPLSSSFFSS